MASQEQNDNGGYFGYSREFLTGYLLGIDSTTYILKAPEELRKPLTKLVVELLMDDALQGGKRLIEASRAVDMRFNLDGFTLDDSVKALKATNDVKRELEKEVAAYRQLSETAAEGGIA